MAQRGGGNYITLSQPLIAPLQARLARQTRKGLMSGPRNQGMMRVYFMPSSEAPAISPA